MLDEEKIYGNAKEICIFLFKYDSLEKLKIRKFKELMLKCQMEITNKRKEKEKKHLQLVVETMN